MLASVAYPSAMQTTLPAPPIGKHRPATHPPFRNRLVPLGPMNCRLCSATPIDDWKRLAAKPLLAAAFEGFGVVCGSFAPIGIVKGLSHLATRTQKQIRQVLEFRR